MRMNICTVVLLLLLLLSAGCRSIPFDKTLRSSDVAGRDPQKVISRFAQQLPNRYELLNGVVLKVGWVTFSALGVLSVDTDEGRFELSCVTPMGMKLFDIEGDTSGARCLYAVPGLQERIDLAASVGEDVRTAYIRMVPAEGASLKRGRRHLTFTESGPGDRRVEYVVAGTPAVLVEKRRYDKGRLACTVGYYQYVERDGMLLPEGMVIRNRRFHYQLTLHLKEVKF